MGVPQIVYPMSKGWDQPGNSAKVVYHKLGLRGNIRHESNEKIVHKIEIIFEHYEEFKANILKMKTAFETNYNPKRVMKLVNRLINK